MKAVRVGSVSRVIASKILRLEQLLWETPVPEGPGAMRLQLEPQKQVTAK